MNEQSELEHIIQLSLRQRDVAFGLGLETAGAGAASTPASNSSISWQGIASNAEFTKFAATAFNKAPIYLSLDSGISWHPVPDTAGYDWNGITAAPDFSMLAATGYDHTTKGYFMCKSGDGGNTWEVLPGAGSRAYQGITANADFTQMAATVWNGNLYKSLDSGATWAAMTGAGTPTSPAPQQWAGITANAAFTKFAATVYADVIYLSIDSGTTWNYLPGSGIRGWGGIAASPDFQTLVAAASINWKAYDQYADPAGGGVYRTTNGGSLLPAGVYVFACMCAYAPLCGLQIERIPNDVMLLI